MMDPKLSGALKTAFSLWMNGAMNEVRERADYMRELKMAMDSDSGDVRIVFHVRANAISIETFDASSETATEIFREQLMPSGTPSELKH